MRRREDGLRVSERQFEFAPGRWIGAELHPGESARFMGASGVNWDVVRQYLLWACAPGTPGDYVGSFEVGQAERERERAKRAAVFARIENEAPDVAVLMRAVRKRFGAGSCVGAEVVLNGQTVLPIAEASDE